MEWFTLTIDGREVSVPKGTTVLEACRMHDIPIPTLCHDPELTSAGACHLCIVQIEGMRNLPPSCVTQAAQGMVVQTQNPKIRAARKTILELLVANHPLDCMTCQKMGNCLLLRLYLVGVGCGGPNFGMTLDESKTEDDILDEEYGVSMIIDKKLSTHLEGAIVDYVESDNGGGFEIRTAKTGNGDGDACGSGGCGGCGGSC